MYNRELGVVNCGTGDGVVIVDGKEYALSPKEALYIGRGHIAKGKDVNKVVEFRSKDASNPAKFFQVHRLWQPTRYYLQNQIYYSNEYT